MKINNGKKSSKTSKKTGDTRNVSESLKKDIAGRQYYKCNNEPGSKLYRLETYDCPMWNHKDEKKRGCFDRSGYEIDHIKEHSITHDDSPENLQALCRNCHIVKTKDFMRKK